MLTDTCRTSKREFANWESSCAAYCAGWSIISIPKQLQDWAHEIMIKAKIKKPGTWMHETAQRPSCRPVRRMCHVQALNTWATANHCCKRCVSPYVTAIPVQHHCLGQQTSSQPYCIHLSMGLRQNNIDCKTHTDKLGYKIYMRLAVGLGTANPSDWNTYICAVHHSSLCHLNFLYLFSNSGFLITSL